MKRNVFLLAICQAMLNTSSSLVIATTALVGLALAPVDKLATVPLGLQFLATMASTIPASLYMRRVGRRAGFITGCFIAIGGALLCTWAVLAGRFGVYCLGAAMLGVFNGFGQYYRFAAAEVAGDEFRSRAISLVLAGGVVAAFAGPNLARVTREMLPRAAFSGSYLSLVGLYVASILVLSFIRMPPVAEAERQRGGRALAEIARQPVFIVAATGGMVAYGVMNLLMTATPLAMRGCGFRFSDTAWVIQWHVLAMFAPSFFTGHIIRRFGVLRVMATGAGLLLGCVAVNLLGVRLLNFSVALVLLGVGWNFLFIGATTLLTEIYTPAEKAKTQGLNDFLVFGTVALTATSSGALQQALGWGSLNVAVTPFVVVALLAVLWLRMRGARVAEAA